MRTNSQLRMSTNAPTILGLTRRSAELTDSGDPWRAMVETTEDHVLLQVLRECTPPELCNIGYYAIALNRCQLLKWWWNRKALPQIDSPSGWIDTLLALQFYRLKVLKQNPTQLLLTIFKSRALREVYPSLLQEDADNPQVHLCQLLVEMASAIPNGTSILYGEWSKYPYGVSGRWWNFEISWRHEISEKELHVDYETITTEQMYTPLLQICRYGNLNDFKLALKNPDWWPNDKNIPFRPDNVRMFPLASMAANKNKQIFRYFIELVWTIKKVCARVPAVENVIWRYCWVADLLTVQTIKETLHILRIGPVPGWKRKAKLLFWLCPELATADIVTQCLDPKQIYATSPHLNHCTFYHFSYTRPVHPRPEDVLWIETQQPLVSIKADGVYYRGCVPKDCYPLYYYRPKIQAEEIDLAWCTLYMVFDVNSPGRWDQRLGKLGEYHSGWCGPYATPDDENRDLVAFLDEAQAAKRKRVWWPKGVYAGYRGEHFFELLSQAHGTPYPNDGWVVAGDQGPLYKVKPCSQLTLDVLYTEKDGWSLCNWHRYTEMMITEFPEQAPLPKNLSYSMLTKRINDMVKDVANADKATKIGALETILTLVALNIHFVQEYKTWRTVLRDKIIEFSVNPQAKVVTDRFQWLLVDPIVRPPGWKEQYTGPPIYDGVWRCVWDSEQRKWRPFCRRYDKFDPNILSIAKLLTKQHEYPWTPRELIPYFQQRIYYTARAPKTCEIRKLHKKQFDDKQKFCYEHKLFAGDMVNLGGGYQRGFTRAFELDPYIVAEQNWLSKYEHYVWADATNLVNPVTKQQHELVRNQVSVQNAIGYFCKDQDSWEAFLRTINSSEKLFVSMIDAELLFADGSNVYTLPDGSTMCRGSQKWCPGVWEGVSHLKWRGGVEHHEPYVSCSFVRDQLSTAGWREVASQVTELGLWLMYWTK